MRTPYRFFALLWLLPVLVGAPAAPGTTQAQTLGRVSFFIGEVFLRTGDAAWTRVHMDEPLSTRHELRTGKESRAELRLGDSVVRMGEGTILRLANLKVKGGKADGALELLFGQVWSKLRNLGGEGLELRSPTAVMAVRGTVFRAAADADSSLDVWVYQGRVDLGNPLASVSQEVPGNPTSGLALRDGVSGEPVPLADTGPVPIPGPFEVTLDEWVQVVKGMRFTLRPDGRYAMTPFNEAEDLLSDWVEWNLKRDRMSGE